MKKRLSQFKLLLAANLTVAVLYNIAIVVLVNILLSRYVFKTSTDIVGSVLTGAVLGVFIHNALASEKKKLTEKENI